MSSNGCVELTAAVDVLARLDPAVLCLSELQAVVAVLAPALGRLAGTQSGLVGERQVRSGGTVPAAPSPDRTPGPDVAVRHWLRDLTFSADPPGRADRAVRAGRSPAGPGAGRGRT